jgi:hypothetical protein
MAFEFVAGLLLLLVVLFFYLKDGRNGSAEALLSLVLKSRFRGARR